MLVTPEQDKWKENTLHEGRVCWSCLSRFAQKSRLGVEVEGRSPTVPLLFRSLMQKVLDKAVVT